MRYIIILSFLVLVSCGEENSHAELNSEQDQEASESDTASFNLNWGRDYSQVQIPDHWEITIDTEAVYVQAQSYSGMGFPNFGNVILEQKTGFRSYSLPTTIIGESDTVINYIYHRWWNLDSLSARFVKMDEFYDTIVDTRFHIVPIYKLQLLEHYSEITGERMDQAMIEKVVDLVLHGVQRFRETTIDTMQTVKYFYGHEVDKLSELKRVE